MQSPPRTMEKRSAATPCEMMRWSDKCRYSDPGQPGSVKSEDAGPGRCELSFPHTLAGTTNGCRYSRVSMASASWSLTNDSVEGLMCSLRPSR